MTLATGHSGNPSDPNLGRDVSSHPADIRGVHAVHDSSVYATQPTSPYALRPTLYSQQGYASHSHNVSLARDDHPMSTYYSSGTNYPLPTLSHSTNYSPVSENFSHVHQGVTEQYHGTPTRREFTEQSPAYSYPEDALSRTDTSPSLQAPSRLGNLHSPLESPTHALVPSQAVAANGNGYFDQTQPSINTGTVAVRSNPPFLPPVLTHQSRGVPYLGQPSPPVVQPHSPSPYTTPLPSPHPAFVDGHQLSTTTFDSITHQPSNQFTQAPFIAAVFPSSANSLQLIGPPTTSANTIPLPSDHGSSPAMQSATSPTMVTTTNGHINHLDCEGKRYHAGTSYDAAGEPGEDTPPTLEFRPSTPRSKSTEETIRMRSSISVHATMSNQPSPSSTPTYMETFAVGPQHSQQQQAPLSSSTPIPMFTNFSPSPAYPYSTITSQQGSNHAYMKHNPFALPPITTSHCEMPRPMYPPIPQVGGDCQQPHNDRQQWQRPTTTASSLLQHDNAVVSGLSAVKRSLGGARDGGSKASKHPPKLKGSRIVQGRPMPYPASRNPSVSREVNESCASSQPSAAPNCRSTRPTTKVANRPNQRLSLEVKIPTFTADVNQQQALRDVSPTSTLCDPDVMSISDVSLVNMHISDDASSFKGSFSKLPPSSPDSSYGNNGKKNDFPALPTTADDPSYRSGSDTEGDTGKKKEKKPKEDRIYQCASCPKRFTRGFNLRSHENTHKGFRPYPCQYCSWSFTRRTDMVRHLKTKHKGLPMIIVCLDARKGTGNNQWTKKKAMSQASPMLNKPHWPGQQLLI